MEASSTAPTALRPTPLDDALARGVAPKAAPLPGIPAFVVHDTELHAVRAETAPARPAVWFALVGAVVFGAVFAVFIGEHLLVSQDGSLVEEPLAVAGGPALESVALPEVAVVADALGPVDPAGHPPPEDPANVQRLAAVVVDTPVSEPQPQPSERHELGGFATTETRARPMATAPLRASRRRRARSLEPVVRTELTTADVRSVVDRGRRRMQQCYNNALRHQGYAQNVRAQLVVTIAPSGEVSRVDVDGPRFGQLLQCLRGVASRWSFPPSRSGSRVPIPVSFSPQE